MDELEKLVKVNHMLYFSSLLKTDPAYKPAADNLFATLDSCRIPYRLLSGTKDIWVRDFMPIKTKSGRYVSFRYEPSYLDSPKYRPSRTNYRQDIAPLLDLPDLTYSHINLDGGNVVFSPSKETVLISDRVFTENSAETPDDKSALVGNLEELLEAEVVIIPSLSPRYDMTGHADGMVRFLDENTALCNPSRGENTLEARIIQTLERHGIKAMEFPYFDSPKDSAIGCYLNFLDTEAVLFLPVFHADMDSDAINMAETVFKKPVVPINVNEIAKHGGVLNCISWET